MRKWRGAGGNKNLVEIRIIFCSWYFWKCLSKYIHNEGWTIKLLKRVKLNLDFA